MPPHPLALTLAKRLNPGARVLDFGSGSGRNGSALRDLGFEVRSIDDAGAASPAALCTLAERFEGAVATHALLHGTPQSVAERIDALARALQPAGIFTATFASKRDARYGSGERVAEATFAPRDGDERGVPHVFYDDAPLRAILAPYFTIESLEERSADAVAGSWAHPTKPLQGAIHWFVIARKV